MSDTVMLKRGRKFARRRNIAVEANARMRHLPEEIEVLA
jgi:hypothetical protein